MQKTKRSKRIKMFCRLSMEKSYDADSGILRHRTIDRDVWVSLSMIACLIWSIDFQQLYVFARTLLLEKLLRSRRQYQIFFSVISERRSINVIFFYYFSFKAHSFNLLCDPFPISNIICFIYDWLGLPLSGFPEL